jgi:hypothetical protein
MTPATFFASLLVFTAVGVNALPKTSPWERRGTVLTPIELSAVVPFAQFARVAYCKPARIEGWKCGRMLYYFLFRGPPEYLLLEACQALPDFSPTLIGGNGDSIQNCRFPYHLL